MNIPFTIAFSTIGAGFCGIIRPLASCSMPGIAPMGGCEPGGGTALVDNGLWNISPSYFVAQTSWNINSATNIGDPATSPVAARS